MSHDKRHLRTLPTGELVITAMSAEDNAPNEIEACHKAQFELGRQYLVEPSGVDAFRTIAELGDDWRSLVHFVDWVGWNEPLPLDECHCVNVSELPEDTSTRDHWALQGGKVIIRSETSPEIS
jgi:hypothetical protein